MIQLILFLLVGIALFLSLYFLARRPRVQGGSQVLVEAREALNALQFNLLPPDLVGRIFAKDDLEYVASQGYTQVESLFLDERKELALCWVARVRSQVLSLRNFHLGSARFYARMSIRMEVGLAMDFALLQLACRALEIVFYLRGPYAAPRMVGAVTGTAAKLCEVSEKSLAFLKPAGVGAYGGHSGGGPAAS